ncbi:MFS transporter, YNFM family, putative membrane transport protein [Streptoalloteichus tenebrarius]|uniref:MFS transporter, YNFM family, putative membrane transport protein n=1 Tax=Streptoalloteichus tenebrarius (strain ATCC 17920 / DSM 40477 / JCM 4838 / CBS 697.72 / NBRC 16177 / NCIMB 11028 / NRRL B-12390 / A12253. 1 / ISP 5477) TaxID=1933 RepID=A0ABT1I270_STRSD|nr:MFS transporter, YNFM family, putative membrane transport protein [Streptoalloteichus tenebrarius]BFF01052.1 MFS transporter [Streptoalloteichus tenebrarius]
MPLRRIGIAVLCAGLAVFALLYAPQPVLPQIAAEFRLDPGTAALAVTVSTAAVAVAVVPVATVSEAVGRRPVMLVSLALAVLVGVAMPFAPTFGALVALRAVQGVAVAGLPATAMAYLAEEIGSTRLGSLMGVYVAGTTVGGMSGRLVAGVVADDVFVRDAGWRGGLVAVSVLSAVCGLLVAWLLPASRRHQRQPLRVAPLIAGLRSAVTDPVLYGPYVVAVLSVGSFIGIYNAIGFRLVSPPFQVSPAVAALVFLAYAAGGICSAVAGRLADRFGRPVVLLSALALTAVGVVMTLPDQLGWVLAGLAVLTGAFFAAHAVSSGWVGARADPAARGQASSVYLFAYYLGSSVGGWLGSTVYGVWGWSALVATTCAWLSAAVVAVVMATWLPAHSSADGRGRRAEEFDVDGADRQERISR